MIHTQSALGKLTLAVVQVLRDNERELMLTLLEDTCGCIHCVLFAACDKHRYRQPGAAGHDSCGDNLKTELSKGASLFRTSSTGCLGPPLALASPSG
jgi:uncharacterized protein YcgI (DUF1989 family)